MCSGETLTLCSTEPSGIYVRVQSSVHILLFTAIICPAPPPGVNTRNLLDADGLSHLERTVDLSADLLGLFYLESYTYSCKEGFITTDELVTTCLPNGTLSLAKPPTCIGELTQTYLVLSVF